MRYILYGAGAIGGVLGACLFRAGLEVVLIARGAHLDAIRRSGLRLETPLESVTLPIPVVGHPREISFDPGRDLVILAMKTQDTEAAWEALTTQAGPGLPVLCAQNGVENERIAARYGARVYGGLVWMPASHLEPGVVQAFAAPVPGIVDVGLYPDGIDARAGRIAGDLEEAGLSARAVPDIMAWKYGKLLTNLGNAIEALCGPVEGEESLLNRAREEALELFALEGIDWKPEEALHARARGLIRMGEIGGRARGGGSSWQSLARGSGAIETAFLNGEIVRLGEKHGRPTPVNRLLLEAATRAARERRPPGSVTLAELRAALEAPADV